MLRVTELAARRLKKQGLSRGWQAWHSQYTQRAWRRRQFRGAAMRLMRPGQAHCLAHWRAMWQAGVAELQAQLSSNEKEAMHAGIAQLQAELRAVREAAAHAAKAAAKLLDTERREAAAQLEATELASGRDLRDVERAAREAGREEVDAARAAQGSRRDDGGAARGGEGGACGAHRTHGSAPARAAGRDQGLGVVGARVSHAEAAGAH